MTQPVSRQRRYQLRQIAAGNCSQCGQPRTGNAYYCDPCRRKALDAKHRRKEKQDDAASQMGVDTRLPKLHD